MKSIKTEPSAVGYVTPPPSASRVKSEMPQSPSSPYKPSPAARSSLPILSPVRMKKEQPQAKLPSSDPETWRKITESAKPLSLPLPLSAALRKEMVPPIKDGVMYMYWLDMHEEPAKPGVIFIFGKVLYSLNFSLIYTEFYSINFTSVLYYDFDYRIRFGEKKRISLLRVH